MIVHARTISYRTINYFLLIKNYTSQKLIFFFIIILINLSKIINLIKIKRRQLTNNESLKNNVILMLK